MGNGIWTWQESLAHLGTPEALASLLGFPLLLALSSWASLRFLRRLPDFPEKADMERTARLAVPVLLAFMAVLFLFVNLLPALTPYPLTLRLLAAGLLPHLGLRLLPRRLNSQLPGCFAWTMAYARPFWTSFWRVRPFVLEEWQRYMAARQYLWQLREKRLRWAHWMTAASALVLAYVTVGFIFPLELDMARIGTAERWEPALLQRLQPYGAKKVSLFPRTTSRLFREPDGHAFVTLRDGSTKAQTQAAAEEVIRFLGEHKRRDYWRVWVTAEHPHVYARLWYRPPPPGRTVAAGREE